MTPLSDILPSPVRWAVFEDEEDGVTLVVHSRKSKRQVSLEFAPYGASVNIVQIDESMHLSEHKCCSDDVLQIGEAIAWLN